MPLCNRVTPLGQLVTLAERGTMMGNRGGRFHDPERQTLTGMRQSASRRWICCRLSWRGRQRPVWGHGYTELFFSDDAAALAAGHRPCFECRRADAVAFRRAWARAHGLRTPTADSMDRALDVERRARGMALAEAPDGSALPQAAPRDLPEGAFLLDRGAPVLWSGGRPWLWSFTQYQPHRIDDLRVPVLSLPSMLACQSAGYVPQLPEALLAAMPTR